jgi:ubiquinone/menaquinone biosynthesis C-methylase UbiE
MVSWIQIMSSLNPKSRFSDRAVDYDKYRPSYPEGLIDFIRQNVPLERNSIIADIGAGTGISTALLVKLGCTVIAIEPNGRMRASADRRLAECPLVSVTDGSAEMTLMPDRYVDLVAVFQAFHWFDPEASRREFTRVLKDSGQVLLVWNDRVTDDSGFQREYERLLQSLPEYGKTTHKNINETRLISFFGNRQYREHVLPNKQVLDWEGVKGRFSSSSYTPPKDSPGYEPVIARLKELFGSHQNNGQVEFCYETHAFLGRFANR